MSELTATATDQPKLLRGYARMKQLAAEREAQHGALVAGILQSLGRPATMLDKIAAEALGAAIMSSRRKRKKGQDDFQERKQVLQALRAKLVNIRLDPFERTGLQQSIFAANWWGTEFWRFVFLQQEMGKEAQTFLEFPPTQKGGSFNLQAVKEALDKKMATHAAE